MQNPFEIILPPKEEFHKGTLLLEKKKFQNGIMWIDLDLLHSIRETSYQYFGCFFFQKSTNLKNQINFKSQVSIYL